MPANFYGSTVYGTGALYGRVAGSLVTAQELFHRETALKVSIIDERCDRWEHFAGTPSPSRADFKVLSNDPRSQQYAYYRLQSSAVKLANGNIYRVRVGDGSLTDFNIYEQTITNPTIASQWTTWSLLYSGTHYACAVAANGSTPHVYTSKAGGLYRDNVLKWSHDDIMAISPVVGTFDALYITAVRDDPVEGSTHRIMELFYTPNIMGSAPEADPMNYRWYDISTTAILLSDGTVLRYNSFPRYNPRSLNNGDSITVCKLPALTNNTPSPPRIIRGLAGEVGHNLIREPRVDGPLSDGYYYLFYAEGHRDNDYELTESGGTGSWWQRSKDGIHWSEPVVSGIPTGVLIEHSGYVWSIAHSLISRRPATSVLYDISNYVPNLNFEIPRNNQEASGECTVANKDGINNSLLTLSDRRMKIELGLRVADGSFEYAELNDWWIKRVVKNIDGAANRLTIQFGDVWTRLASALRDNFNFVGQLKWNDWSAGKRNKAFNYFFVSDTAPVDTDDKLTTKGIVLYTGWKGQNATVQVHFSGVTGDPSIVFRYLDSKNYQRIEKQGSTLVYIDRVDGVETTIDSAACASDTSPIIKVVFTWEDYQAYVNGVLVLDSSYADQPNVKPGYVGFKATSYTITSFSLQDWEPVITSAELIKTALAMGDYHDVSTGETSSEELAIVWGPQTDIPTPADGARQALDAMKWEMVWLDGRIRVGSFKDLTITKVIDNRIIKTDYVDEANKHINLASVDGNEDPWLEVDVIDTQQRDRQMSAYFDLPELTDQDSVRGRAIEEIRRGKLGRTPGGQVPLFFDLWRMDAITWIDNAGESNDVRVEGISVEIDQGMTPSQRETLDTSLLNA